MLVGAWVTIALVSAAVIRRPLSDSLSVHPHRHASSWITTFLELLLVTAAVLAVYEAHRSEHELGAHASLPRWSPSARDSW